MLTGGEHQGSTATSSPITTDVPACIRSIRHRHPRHDPRHRGQRHAGCRQDRHGIIGHSYALIADGIESINDIVASVVVLISLKVSSKPPDEDHPYGHGKAEQLGALFSAISLLAAGATIAFQSTKNLFSRHESPAWFTLPVLLIVIVTKEVLSRYALKKSDETSSSALKGDAWHHRSDAITSAAAFLGIVVALIGGRGYEKADDIAALVGCLVIGFNGISLLRTALHENMDGAAPAELLQRAEFVASRVPHVRRVEKLRMKRAVSVISWTCMCR